jgi:pyruvate-ferredoxin/flavodoxin oxidoreductase
LPKFIENEVRYNSLKLQFPEEAAELFAKTAEDAAERLQSYQRLASI